MRVRAVDARPRPDDVLTSPDGRRLQVLHVVTRYLRGGSEARLRDIVAALPEADHHVVCGVDSDLELLQAHIRADVVVREPALVRPPSPKDVAAFRRIRKVVRRRHFDLIFTHQSKAGVLTRMATNGTPVIHSLSMANFGTGYAAWQDRLFRTIERRLASKTSAYAVVGSDLAARYAANGVPLDKMHIVRSGVAMPPAEVDRAAVRARHAVPLGRPLVLYLGSLEERKGVLDLPALAQRLLADAAERPFLFVAGEGPLHGDLAALVLEHRLEADVRLAGFVDEPGELVAAADVVVLLSRAEGISQALVQAAAAGTPFVAMEVDGARELLEMGADGIVVPSGDVEAAAAAIVEVIRREPRGAAVDLDAWDPSAIRQRYREVVRSVLGPRKPEERIVIDLTVDPEPAAAERNSMRSAPATPRKLTKLASLNAAAGVLDQIGRMVVETLIKPVLVNTLGKATFGVWTVLWRWNHYVWAMGGRSAQALQWVVANRQHTATDEERQRYVGASVVVWFMFLPVIAAMGAISAWAAPLLLHVPSAQAGAVRMTAGLLALDAALMTLLTIPKAVLSGQNLGHKRLGLTTILTLVGGGLTVLAVTAGLGVSGVALAHLVTTVLTGVLFWRVAKTYLPWFRAARPDRTMVRWFLGMSGWFTAWKIINQAMLAGDVVVLGLVGSVEDVTVLSLSRHVPEALMALMITAFQGVAPGLGGLIGAGEMATARTVRNEVFRFTWAACTAFGAAILMWNPTWLRLWVGGDNDPGAVGGMLVVVMIIQFIFIRTDAQIIDLTLQMRTKVILAFISTVVSLGGAAVALEAGYGIAGLAGGVIAGRMILTIAYPLIVGRALGQHVAEQLRGAVRPVVVMALFFAAAAVLGPRITTDSWFVLVAGSGATALVALVASAFLGLPSLRRRELVARARKVVTR
jgi:glycosyltransferase involved in cell wall biosynthesis